MAKSRIQTERLQVMLAMRTHTLLAALADKGMHGTSVTDVAKTLIENGLREARKDGFLSEEDIRAAQRSR